MDEIKLSEEELNKLIHLQETQNQIIDNLGQIEYNIQVLELQKEKLTEKIEQLKKSEVKVGQDLTEKYGNGSISLNSGTFTKAKSNLESS
jgi:hypothetical protein|tara:strand:+ start:159 stop:428 length:270 start_codon:yes stop_codon:yes gene_type:complete